MMLLARSRAKVKLTRKSSGDLSHVLEVSSEVLASGLGDYNIHQPHPSP